MRKIYTDRQDKEDTDYIGKKADKKLTWKRKRNLKGKKIWIEEDLTWKERLKRRKYRRKKKEKKKCLSRRRENKDWEGENSRQ